jgi:peptidoglycan/xylan/chitin deacetylase (PgdA/CDA1 family)
MVVVHLQHFPLDMQKTPFVPTGGLERVYPDFWHYTMRDYGNRVGIYRLMDALQSLGIKATAAVNSDLATRYPVLVRDIAALGWEVAAAGKSMGHLHHAGLEEEAERRLVNESVETLRKASGQQIRGWASPAGSQSWRTTQLVAEAGLDYITDYINDELPFALSTPSGRLTALPVSLELSDTRLIAQQSHSTAEYVREVLSAHAYLAKEANAAGRLLTLQITPWIMGQAHRIRAFTAMLQQLGSSDATWFATGSEVLDGWNIAFPNNQADAEQTK